MEQTLLKFLRRGVGITSVKDGCSGQAACGACMVEIDGKARLSCTQKMKFLEGKKVLTMEGIPEQVRDIIAKAYVNKGAVQCGFCTPGLIMRTKVLFSENQNPNRDHIKKAINLNLCRCTGYIKIVDAVEEALKELIKQKNRKPNRKKNRSFLKKPGLEILMPNIRLMKQPLANGNLLTTCHSRECCMAH